MDWHQVNGAMREIGVLRALFRAKIDWPLRSSYLSPMSVQAAIVQSMPPILAIAAKWVKRNVPIVTQDRGIDIATAALPAHPIAARRSGFVRTLSGRFLILTVVFV
ncbi:MAG: hypothetical protein U5N55_07400, partial [Cypionkella sp.]|nr:hypothetical protein [Cypionkella sp.]